MSTLEQHRWVGYYIQAPPDMNKERGGPPDEAQHALELMVHRTVGRGIREDLLLTNVDQKASSLSFALELDADFADQKELLEGWKQHGELSRTRRQEGKAWQLRFEYSARHHYQHQCESGIAELHRGVVIVFSHYQSELHMDGSAVSLGVELEPGDRGARVSISFLAWRGDGPADGACIFTGRENDLDQKERRFKLKGCSIEAALSRWTRWCAQP